MRFFKRARCVECGSRNGLFQWATKLWICRDCAVQYGYHTALVSVQEWLGLRS